MRDIPFSDFKKMHDEISGELNAAIQSVISHNWFIRGINNETFEQEFSTYCGVKHCVGCGNGLDALQLILRAYGIGEGDEVIVPAHTFIATALAVTYAGARPVFVDVEKDYYCLNPQKVESAITKKTRAIIMVHIYGQVGRFDEVKQVAKTHNLLLIEDAAQAHGAEYRHQRTGSLGDAAGFSFYPGKNLGAFGDGGSVTTQSAALEKAVRMMGNYGSEIKYKHEYKGVNSRLDEIQAAVLNCKLPHLNQWNEGRRTVAQKYLSGISNDYIVLPKENPEGRHVWHLFAVMADDRVRFMDHLSRWGIKAQIHYPVPMHLHQAYQELGYQIGQFPVAEYIAAHEVSLPIYYQMEDDSIAYVIDVINQYRK